MALEIERRFLVSDPLAAFRAASRSVFIVQGYFGRVHDHAVRIRLMTGEEGDRQGVLTFKGRRQGCCRPEFEYPLAATDATEALKMLSASEIVRKRRYYVTGEDGLRWEVDRFYGRNHGLVIAEVELDNPDEHVRVPAWAGKEITCDHRYGNSQLAIKPMAQYAAAA